MPDFSKRTPNLSYSANTAMAYVLLKNALPEAPENEQYNLAEKLGQKALDSNVRLNWFHARGLCDFVLRDGDKENCLIGSSERPSDEEWAGILKWIEAAKAEIAKVKNSDKTI